MAGNVHYTTAVGQGLSELASIWRPTDQASQQAEQAMGGPTSTAVSEGDTNAAGNANTSGTAMPSSAANPTAIGGAEKAAMAEGGMAAEGAGAAAAAAASDFRLKDFKKANAIKAAGLIGQFYHILSDEDLKLIRSTVDPKELVAAIIDRGKSCGFNEFDLDILDEGTSWQQPEGELDDEILQKYAEHVYNYEYTYKPEAQSVDPRVDSDTVHTGPMAQDLEQVNAATVQTDPKTSYKSVDTGRLALMNAGAIGAIARELLNLKKAVNND